MAGLSDVLGNIPGLAGYLGMEQLQRQNAMQDLQGVTTMFNAVEQAKQRQLQQSMLGLQIQEALRKQQFQGGILDLIRGNLGQSGASPNGGQNSPDGTGVPQAPGGTQPGRLNMTGLALALSGLPGGPTAGQMLHNATDPGKVVWRDDGAKLVPVFENNGQIVPGLEPIVKTMAPGERANLEEKTRQFDSLSAADRIKLDQSGARLQYETGAGGAPSDAPAPAAPSPSPGVFYAPTDEAAAQMAKSLQAGGARNFQVTTDPARAGIAPAAPPAGTGLPPAESNKLRRAGIELANKDFVEKSYRPTLQDAQAARASNAVIDAYRSLPISQQTGWGTQAMAAAANVLTGLGIAPEQAKQLATNSQVFQKLAMEQNWQMLVEQKGVQTEGDAQRASKVFAQLSNTPEANEFIWDFSRAMNDLKVAKARFYQQRYDQARNSGDISSIETAWAEHNKNWSLFDQPSMKKWKDRAAASTPQTGQFEVGKTYIDGQGRRARYLGDGKWQSQ